MLGKNKNFTVKDGKVIIQIELKDVISLSKAMNLIADSDEVDDKTRVLAEWLHKESSEYTDFVLMVKPSDTWVFFNQKGLWTSSISKSTRFHKKLSDCEINDIVGSNFVCFFGENLEIKCYPFFIAKHMYKKQMQNQN